MKLTDLILLAKCFVATSVFLWGLGIVGNVLYFILCGFMTTEWAAVANASLCISFPFLAVGLMEELRK